MTGILHTYPSHKTRSLMHNTKNSDNMSYREQVSCNKHSHYMALLQNTYLSAEMIKCTYICHVQNYLYKLYILHNSKEGSSTNDVVVSNLNKQTKLMLTRMMYKRIKLTCELYSFPNHLKKNPYSYFNLTN
jgi:hypothetical protein